jgi:Nucleotidyltransferase of unknown function (DUF6036)
MEPKPIPEPWLSFLKEIEESLGSEVQFHCFGGFAITYLFGLSRPTSDIDILSGLVREKHKELFNFAGKGSLLHKKYAIYLDLVGTIAVVPEDYANRLTEITPSSFRFLRLFVMEPHDIVLSKVSRNYPHDIEDVQHLAKTADLDVELLRERYKAEVEIYVIGPPERTKGNLDFWIRMIKEIQSGN